MTSENAFFVRLGDERLFAFLHLPDAPLQGAAVLCAPLAEEKLWSHRVFVSFARALAGRGFAVLRFDYRGEGDSDRGFEESDFDSRVADTHAAIDELKRLAPGAGPVTLVGLRLGATIAAAAAATRDDVEQLLLWDPVTDGADYMQSVLRTNLMAQMAIHRKVVEDREALVARLARGDTVNIEGYALSDALFRQASAVQLAPLLAARPRPAQLVSIAARAAPPRPDLAAIAASHAQVSVATAAEEPFWKEIKAFYQDAGDLFRVSLDWLGAAT